MRQIFLDTETTGLSHENGDRVIEIGCVEMFNRRLTGNNLHFYINPERDSHEDAIRIHGITNEFLIGKPRFAEIAEQFCQYIAGAELVIHNAAFDVGFINHEFSMLHPQLPPVGDYCAILDTLLLAREMHPGQKNNLDALCRRYDINNSHRTLHGALLDAEILADVYLLMTGGQVSLNLANEQDGTNGEGGPVAIKRSGRLKVLQATAEELAAHENRLDLVPNKGGSCLWRN